MTTGKNQEKEEELHNLRDRNAQLERSHAELTIKFAATFDALLLARTYERINLKEIDGLKAEVAHWKANHNNMVNRSRMLIDRPDLPLERVKAFKQLETLKAENERLRNAAKEAVEYLERIADTKGLIDGGFNALTILRASMTPDTEVRR